MDGLPWRKRGDWLSFEQLSRPSQGSAGGSDISSAGGHSADVARRSILPPRDPIPGRVLCESGVGAIYQTMELGARADDRPSALDRRRARGQLEGRA